LRAFRAGFDQRQEQRQNSDQQGDPLVATVFEICVFAHRGPFASTGRLRMVRAMGKLVLRSVPLWT